MAGEVAETLLMTDRPEFSENSVNAAGAPFARLIERAKSGDMAAFEQLIIFCQRKVVATAWRVLGNEDDARDAAQEVFLRVFKYLKKFRSGEDFSGWLYRININVCRDIQRKRARSDKFSSFEQEHELGNLEALSSKQDIEAAAILSQEQAIIALALKTLSQKERAALVLRDLEGLPTDEVARILGSSQTTVRSQISSARTKIKLYRDRFLKRG